MPISCIWQFRELVSYIHYIQCCSNFSSDCRHDCKQNFLNACILLILDLDKYFLRYFCSAGITPWIIKIVLQNFVLINNLYKNVERNSLPVVKIFAHDCRRQPFGLEHFRTQYGTVFLTCLAGTKRAAAYSLYIFYAQNDSCNVTLTVLYAQMNYGN